MKGPTSPCVAEGKTRPTGMPSIALGCASIMISIARVDAQLEQAGSAVSFQLMGSFYLLRLTVARDAGGRGARLSAQKAKHPETDHFAWVAAFWASCAFAWLSI